MSDPPRGRRGRRLLLGLGTASGALLLLFVLLEATLRLLGYGTYIIYRPDDRLLWVPIPDQRGVTVDGHQRITISQDGFRYPHALGSEAQELRVFAFGDSVTMGWGVDDDSHFCAQLEELLNGEALLARTWQVISAGVNAYPNALVLERYRKVVEDGYDPDIVILGSSFNTNHEGLVDLTGVDRDRFLRKVALKSIVRRSSLYNFLIEGLLRDLVYYRIRDQLVQGSWELEPDRRDEAAEKFGELLREVAIFSEAHDVRIIILILGSRDQKQEEDLFTFQQMYIDVANELDLPVVNMIERLRSEDHDQLFLDHAHLNRRGHEKVAREIANAIRGIVASWQDTGDAATAEDPGRPSG